MERYSSWRHLELRRTTRQTKRTLWLSGSNYYKKQRYTEAAVERANPSSLLYFYFVDQNGNDNEHCKGDALWYYGLFGCFQHIHVLRGLPYVFECDIPRDTKNSNIHFAKVRTEHSRSAGFRFCHQDRTSTYFPSFFSFMKLILRIVLN